MFSEDSWGDYRAIFTGFSFLDFTLLTHTHTYIHTDTHRYPIIWNIPKIPHQRFQQIGKRKFGISMIIDDYHISAAEMRGASPTCRTLPIENWPFNVHLVSNK